MKNVKRILKGYSIIESMFTSKQEERITKYLFPAKNKREASVMALYSLYCDGITEYSNGEPITMDNIELERYYDADVFNVDGTEIRQCDIQSYFYDFKKNEVIDFINKLVGTRLTISELSTVLRRYFNVISVEVINSTKERLKSNDNDGSADYNLITNIKTENYNIDIDIYALPTRLKENKNKIYYITEVGYEFN